MEATILSIMNNEMDPETGPMKACVTFLKRGDLKQQCAAPNTARSTPESRPHSTAKRPEPPSRI